MRRALTLVGILGLVATAALMLGRPAGAQVLGGSAVNATGRSNRTLSAPRYVSTAASGSNGFACTVDGCRFDLGTGANDYWYSASGNLTTPGAIVSTGGSVSGTAFAAYGTASAVLRGGIGDGATAIGVKIQNFNALTTPGAKIVSFYSDNGTTEKASIDKDGVVNASGGFSSPLAISSALRLHLTASPALPTCTAGFEGGLYRQSGGTSGARTKLCLCTSDGAGTPAYAWKNISVIAASEAASIGDATTCP